LNIAGEQFPTFNAYNGKVAYEIFVSGCDNHCFGCHNPELQNFQHGTSVERYVYELYKRMNEARNMFDIIAILGGDLHSQNVLDAALFIMFLRTKFHDKEFWLFTGCELDNLHEYEKDMFDVIKTGKYIQELHQEGFPASSNQKILRKGVDY